MQSECNIEFPQIANFLLLQIILRPQTESKELNNKARQDGGGLLGLVIGNQSKSVVFKCLYIYTNQFIIYKSGLLECFMQ